MFCIYLDSISFSSLKQETEKIYYITKCLQYIVYMLALYAAPILYVPITICLALH